MTPNSYAINSLYQSTATAEDQNKVVVFSLGDYEISIVVDSLGRFVRVEGIRVKKECVNHSSKFSAEKFLDDYLSSCED